MKFKIYKEEPKPEETTYFKLDDTNTLFLIVVDENGNKRDSGNILYIDEKGIHLIIDVNKNFGLPLDKEGKIVICK